jgi:hypothetical protein
MLMGRDRGEWIVCNLGTMPKGVMFQAFSLGIVLILYIHLGDILIMICWWYPPGAMSQLVMFQAFSLVSFAQDSYLYYLNFKDKRIGNNFQMHKTGTLQALNSRKLQSQQPKKESQQLLLAFFFKLDKELLSGKQ